MQLPLKIRDASASDATLSMARPAGLQVMTWLFRFAACIQAFYPLILTLRVV